MLVAPQVLCRPEDLAVAVYQVSQLLEDLETRHSEAPLKVTTAVAMTIPHPAMEAVGAVPVEREPQEDHQLVMAV